MTQSVPEGVAPTDPAGMTTYIEPRYHARHREQLPDLVALAAKIEQVHADMPAVPTGLADLLQRLIGELEVHMKKEELIVFPAIRRGGIPGIENPIAVMRADHDDHEAEVARTGDLHHAGLSGHPLRGTGGTCGRARPARALGTAQLPRDHRQPAGNSA